METRSPGHEKRYLGILGACTAALLLSSPGHARTRVVTDHEALVARLLAPPAPGAIYRFDPALVARAELDADGLILRNGPLLAKLAFLRTLSLRRARVPGFAFLAAMPLLERLDLSATSIRSLASLARCRRLRELDLSDTAVSDLRPLAGLARLEHLDLSNSRVKSLSPLRGRRLSSLTLGARRPWVLPNLEPLGHVTRLVLRSPPADLDLRPLGKVQVEELVLEATTLPRLEPLVGHHTLGKVVLVGTRVDLPALRALLRRWPGLEVVMPDGRRVGRVVVTREVPPDPRDYPCLMGWGPCEEERFGPRREPVVRFVLP